MDNQSRLEFPCPKCSAGIGSLCISVAGMRMARFVHPERGREEGRLDNILKLREWLLNYGDIFRLPE